MLSHAFEPAIVFQTMQHQVQRRAEEPRVSEPASIFAEEGDPNFDMVRPFQPARVLEVLLRCTQGEQPGQTSSEKHEVSFTALACHASIQVSVSAAWANCSRRMARQKPCRPHLSHPSRDCMHVDRWLS